MSSKRTLSPAQDLAKEYILSSIEDLSMEYIYEFLLDEISELGMTMSEEQLQGLAEEVHQLISEARIIVKFNGRIKS